MLFMNVIKVIVCMEIKFDNAKMMGNGVELIQDAVVSLFTKCNNYSNLLPGISSICGFKRIHPVINHTFILLLFL